MKSIFNFFLFLFLFFAIPIFSQFVKEDSLLIYKTFTRDWKDKIFLEYLNSNDSRKQNAALLSVSHSNDTSFVTTLTSIKNNNCRKNIFFALGQIGYSSQSIDYLHAQLKASSEEEIFYALEALGKIGTQSDFEKFIKSLESHKISHGVATAIMNFHLRGFKDSLATSYLWEELFSAKDNQLIKEIAFALYRMRANISETKKLESQLNKIFVRGDNVTAIQYLLGIYRNNKQLPISDKLFKSLCESRHWILRNEIASTGVYYAFTTEEQLHTYLKLLEDDNFNVQRNIATALKRIQLQNNFAAFLNSAIEKKFSEKEISHHVFGELLNSYLHLNTSEKLLLYDKFQNKLSEEYRVKIFGEHKEFDQFSFDAMNEIFYAGEIKAKIEVVTSISKIFGRTKADEMRKFIFEQMKSEFPPLVSIAADNIDSATIANHSNELKSLIKEYIKINIHSADHLEAILSLYNLSEKISNNFHEEIKNLLSVSKVYSLKRIAAPASKKTDEMFHEIWAHSFEYSFATIKTTKGNFKLKLMSEVAPITVANFVFLAEKNFYNGISFHRVVPGFVIQGGDPSGSGWGGPGYEIISEFSTENYSAGVAGIASAGKDTEGSQWFIMQAEHMHLNGRYTIWAKIISGQDVVDDIEQDDSIISITLH